MTENNQGRWTVAKNSIKRWGVIGGFCALLSAPAQAAFNPIISFQGVLKQSNSTFVPDGSYCAKVTLRKNGALFWQKSYGSLPVSQGAFTVGVTGTDNFSTPLTTGLFVPTSVSDVFTVDIALDYSAASPSCSGATYPDSFTGIQIYAVPMAMMADQCNTLTGSLEGSQINSDGTLPLAALAGAGVSGNVLTANGTAWVSQAPPVPYTVGGGSSSVTISGGSGSTTIGNFSSWTQINGAASIGNGSALVNINTGGAGPIALGSGSNNIGINGNITSVLTTTGNNFISLGVGSGASSFGTGSGTTNMGTGTGITNIGNSTGTTAVTGASAGVQGGVTISGSNSGSAVNGDGIDIIGTIPNGGLNNGVAVGISGTGSAGNSNGVVIDGVGAGTGIGVGINVLGSGSTAIGSSSAGSTSIQANSSVPSSSAFSLNGTATGSFGTAAFINGNVTGNNGTGLNLSGNSTGTSGTGISINGTGTGSGAGVAINQSSGSTVIGNSTGNSPLSLVGQLSTNTGAALSLSGANTDAGFGVQMLGNTGPASFATGISIVGNTSGSGGATVLSGSSTNTGVPLAISGTTTYVSSASPALTITGVNQATMAGANNPGIVIAGTGAGSPASGSSLNNGIQIGLPSQSAFNSTQIFGASVPSRLQISLFEEFGFVNPIATSGLTGQIGSVQGMVATGDAGGSILQTAPTVISHPGLARIASGTSGSYVGLGWCSFSIGGTVTAGTVLLGATDRFTFDTEIDVSSIAVSTGIVRIGLWDSFSATAIGSANGIYIEQTTGTPTVKGYTVKTGANTAAVASATMTVGTFQRWTINFDGANLQFFLNGAPFGPVVTNLVNLPTTVPLCVGIQQSGSTVTRNVDVDYMSFQMVPGVAR